MEVHKGWDCTLQTGVPQEGGVAEGASYGRSIWSWNPVEGSARFTTSSPLCTVWNTSSVEVFPSPAQSF
jgi:hypothetical protein